MVLAEQYRVDEPTHQLRVRPDATVSDADSESFLAVENRVIETAMDDGSAVHLCIEETVHTDRLVSLRTHLPRVEEDERALENGVPEYRAELPDERSVVEEVLTVIEGETDRWLDRLHGIAEIAIFTEDTWLYRSVPHETHIREINAGAANGVLSALRDAIEEIPRAGIVPDDPLASWETGDRQYELRWDRLQWSGDGTRWRTASLEGLNRVVSEPARSELVFDWEPPAGLGRLRWAIQRYLGVTDDAVPTRVTVPPDHFESALNALAILQRRLGYEYECIA